jgi:hypothetical protein
MGKQAFAGGSGIALLGLLCHYIISFSFTFFFLGCMVKQVYYQKTGLLLGLFMDYLYGW